ncbi:MAG: InlB B-repeat-containing protein [Candidatus Enterosoma sp.]|nr:InlB B-repeat-containing protein [bacterium]MDY5909441.1 InlB B-repeat-containing protein [Candidatus Enterosoma sp.]
MNKSICNICGGNLINKNGRWVCENCGAFLPEEITNEQLSLLYDANQKLRLADFDLAEELYSDIIRKYSDCSDAYFGRALAHYGIRLEKDVDGRMIPTCFFPEYQSLFENSDFKKAYDLADSKQKQYLKEKADEIEAIRKEWVDKAKKEGPYDIFISFKATKPGDDTEETEDSREAWDIARELEKCGYRVFFSKDALANKTGDHYEPYIFNALNTCHVMLVYASKPEYVESVWVRNEWARYYEKIKNKEDGKLPNSLILIYKNFNPSKDLRRPFSHSENINRNDIDFLDRLKNYVASVISESKIITPKVIPDKIESYIPSKNERLKGAKKKIVGNSIAPSGSFVPTVQIREKAFGKYSTQKLTGTAESELSRGEVLLRKERYNDALECYKGILLNNKNNANAALGVLLSASECTDLGEFISNKYVGSDEQNKLINVVIQYSKKDVTNKIFEQMIAFIKLEIKKADNIELAYKAYKEIKDFNSSEAVRKCHKEICDELLKNKCFSNDACFAFIDDILFNCQTGYDTYVNALLAVINALINSSMFEKACAYLKLLEKVAFGTKDYYSCLYRIYTRQSTFAEALLAYINGGNIKKIAGDIDGTNTDTANWILNNLISTILASYTKISIDVLSDAFSVLTCYVNPYVDRLTDTLMAYCISEPSPEVDKLFETILQSFSESRKNEFIECIFAYAKAYMERSDFNSAKKYLNYALQYDRTNANLLCYLFYASIESIDETNVYRNLYKLKDFGTIEKILGLQKNDDEIAKTNAKFVEEAISYVSKYGKSSEKGIFPVFEQLIKYYAADCTDQLIKDLYNMADACKESTLFEEAEKYYALIVGTDSSEHAAYWGLLQAKLKCRNESEMIEQDVLINALPEFNNAITSAGNNKSVIEKYIDCSISQQKYLESKKRKKKNRKIFVAVSSVTASVLLVFCLVFSLAVNIFIPNSKYENAVSLINNRKYYQAYEQLKGFDYADSSSQLSIAKAGLAFDRGDYKEGIDCMYNVGGITNINYDGNGGKVPASSQTVKKLKNWVNNEPLYAGYSFYGWVIDSFSIKTRKNSYLCNLNLKATWKLVNYSISYALNGSTLENKVETYNCLSQDFSLGQPQKKGYTFDGWSGTGLSEITKDVVVPQGSIGDRAYEAHFTAKSYNVTYDYGYDGVTSKATATYDSQFNVKSPSREGYNFIGWTYNGEEFASKTWDIDSDITLIAHWKAKKYKISYDLNGGDNSPANLNEYTIETPTFTLSDPAKSGYDFVGWSGTGISGVSKDVAIEKGAIGNREFTANWKAHTYIVNLDSNGGQCSTSKMNVDYNEKLVLPQPTKTGYTFAGWFNAEDNAEVTDCMWKFLYDLNLYAKWNINTYTITYVLGGGVNDENNPIAYNVESDDITLNNPTRSGYTFAGWNSKLGNKQFNPTISQGSIGDISFEATWEANLNTIVFFGNGNTNGETKSQQAYTGSKLKLNANGYIRDGYTFIGWSESPDGTVKYSDQGEITVPVNSIYNLYAVWTPNLNTITFNGNGADSGTMDAQRMRTDTTEILATNGFAKTGYHFAGWSANPMGEVKYADEGAYRMGPNSSYDLYAKWEPNEYVITYNPNSGIVSRNSDKVIFDNQFILIVPTRNGYEFSGWYIGETQLTDSRGGSLAKYGIAGNITVVAHWKPNLNVVLTIVDGTTTCSYGETDSFIRLPKISQTKENNIFVGWSNTVDGDVLYKNEDLYKIGPKSSYTLYGIWKDVSSYQSISNCDDLKNIKQNGKYYLTDDIDCNDVQWSPLFDFDTPFVGEIYGDGHYIYNVNMVNFGIDDYYKTIFGDPNKYGFASPVSYYAYTGLFCKVGTGAVISDVNIQATISGRFCGLTVGRGWDTVQYVGFYNFGGICGLNEGSINGCTTSLYFDNPILAGKQEVGGTTSSTANIGGIAGTNNGTISNCFSYLSGTKFKTEGVNRTNYYGTAIFNESEYTTYDESSNSISSSNGKTASLNFDGKTPVVVLIDGEVDSVYWIDNYEPFLTSIVSNPSKYGYTLMGWNYKGHVYSLNEYIYPEYGSSILIEPVFSPNDTSLVLNANNGKENENKNILVKTGESIALNQYKNGITVPYGYYFAGWSSIQGNTAEYDSDAIFKSDGNSKTLYAVWLPNKNSIVFNNNGGEGNMTNQSIFTNETVSLVTCTFNAPKGHYFAGWSSSPDGEVEYNDCSNITSNGESVINLYAIWKPIY